MMAMAPAADYGSIWGKISGSSTDTSTSVDEVLGGVPTTIDTSFNQKTFSLLAGADFHPSDDLRVGVFAGYIQSNVSFSSYGASAAFSGGTVGAYVAYTQGGFYADAEGKADILDLTYTAPFGGSFSASGLSTTVGVTANTGYRMEMGNNVFIEPLATVSYAYTTIGGFSNGGTSVTYTNGQSLQAGAGVKVGTSFSIVAGTTTELALTGKVMNEFGPDNSVTVTDSVDSYSFSTNSAGAFGLLDVAATTYSDDKSMSGFVSVGGTFSSDTHSVNVKAGLRKAF
jgi:outer membrane autotransporter protein